MDKRTIKRIIRQLNEAAGAISELEEEIVHCLAENGCDLPMPQQLQELASRLEPIGNGDGYASVLHCRDENPGKKIYVDDNFFSYAL